MGMSATAANDPSHMRGLGAILGFHDGTERDFVRWAKENGCSEEWSGQLKFYGGLHVLAQLHQSIYPEHGNRLRIAEVPEFPETQIAAEVYDMDKNTKHINQAYRDLARELALIEAKSALAKNRLTVLLRARQRIELLKVPVFVELGKEALKEGKSVAYFLNFEATIQAIAKALKTDCIIHGGQSDTLRNKFIDDFQADKERVIICNIQAGGVSISLHDLNGKHPRYAIHAPTWSSFNTVQAFGRVWRAGGKTKSIQRIVYAAGTVEDQVAANVNAKMECLNTLNDGDLNAGAVLFA